MESKVSTGYLLVGLGVAMLGFVGLAGGGFVLLVVGVVMGGGERTEAVDPSPQVPPVLASAGPEAPPTAEPAEARPTLVSAPAPSPGTGVFINGRELTAAQVGEMARTYGTPPQPGRWWYDPRSGLFGRVGEPVFGSVRPGHDFGPLSANASRGTSGVYLNGRNLPPPEVALYSMLLGPIQPGRYWLDGQGNVGHEGNAMPVANLLVAAQVAGMMAQGGGAPAGGGSPADAWLSGNEWSGEARVGGMPMTSGTWDTSGGGNHVISVDGQVLNLPPY